MEHYNPSGTTLINATTMNLPINVRNNAMEIGMAWATASVLTSVYEDATPDLVSYSVDSRSLLGVEDDATVSRVMEFDPTPSIVAS